MLLEHFITVFVGAAIILFTAHFSVKYSIRLARHFNVGDTFLGMTVLAIGTSLPEIITSIDFQIYNSTYSLPGLMTGN